MRSSIPSPPWLGTDDQRLAQSRAPLIREECQQLPLVQLCHNVRQALQTGDRVGIWLYARYLSLRLVDATPQASSPLSELRGLWQVLQVAVEPPSQVRPMR